MKADSQAFEERIRRFSKARRSLLNATLVYRLGAWALVGGVVALVLLSGWLPNAFVNLGLFLALAAFLVVLLVRLAIRWSRFRACLTEAFTMEELAGGLNSRLVSAWDFLESRFLTPLTNAVIERAGTDLNFDFESRLDRAEHDERRKRFVLWLALFLALGVSPWFGFGRFAANFRYSLLAASEYLFPVEYEVLPGFGRHIRRLGESVEVSLRFKRHGFQRVTLVRQSGETTTRLELPVDANGLAKQALTSDVEAEFGLRFEFGERRTDEIQLVFTTLPALVNMQTELIFPSYTQLLPRSLEGIQSRLLGLPGTRITLGFTFSKELRSATMTWDSGEELPLEAVGRFATVSLLHTQERRASLQIRDIHDFALEYPLAIDFALQRDEKPKLFLPKHLQEDMPFLEKAIDLFGFGVRIQDDYGVTRCLLKWQKSTVDSPTNVRERGEIERLISPVRRQAVVNFEKIFAGHNLKPGDKVSFQVEVYDNRAPDRQVTVSRRCSFFIHQEELGGLTIKELGFGSGALAARGRIPKSMRSTMVKEPEGRRGQEKVRNEYEANIVTGTRPPKVHGEHGQATRDYFRLLSTVSYKGEKGEKKEDKVTEDQP